MLPQIMRIDNSDVRCDADYLKFLSVQYTKGGPIDASD